MKPIFYFLTIVMFLLLLAAITSRNDYFPSPESEGGWRKNTDSKFVRSLGLDPAELKGVGGYGLSVPSTELTSVIVIKDGWIVGEWYSDPRGKYTGIYLSSVGKSFATACFGIAVKDSQEGKLRYALDRKAKVYDPRWLPEGFPLSDPAKAQITFDHIFQHTSGLAPQITGDGKGELVEQGRNHWSDYVLWVVGRDPLWPKTAPLYFPPGVPEEYPHHVKWGDHLGAYSSVGYAHIGLVLAELYQIPAHDFLWNRLMEPLGFSGVEYYNPPEPPEIKWFSAGGLKLTPRDFARFAYFLLLDGKWQDKQILPKGWLHSFTRTPNYQNLRSNIDGYFGTQYPKDLFRIFGSGGNFAFIIPSHNLIVLKTGRINNYFMKRHQRDLLNRTFRMISGYSPDN